MGAYPPTDGYYKPFYCLTFGSNIKYQQGLPINVACFIFTRICHVLWIFTYCSICMTVRTLLIFLMALWLVIFYEKMLSWVHRTFLLWDTVAWWVCLHNACPRTLWHGGNPWNHLGVIGNDGEALFRLWEGVAMLSTDGSYVNTLMTLIWAAINANFSSPSK